MIKRKSDWPEILSAELDAALNREFEFGKHDCCLFAANTLKAMTGKDFAKGLRGYRSAAGSVRVLQKRGKGTLLKTMNHVMRQHKCPTIKPAQARRGDIVFGRPTGADAVGICTGVHSAFAGDGIVYTPTAQMMKAWRCG